MEPPVHDGHLRLIHPLEEFGGPEWSLRSRGEGALRSLTTRGYYASPCLSPSPRYARLSLQGRIKAATSHSIVTAYTAASHLAFKISVRLVRISVPDLLLLRSLKRPTLPTPRLYSPNEGRKIERRKIGNPFFCVRSFCQFPIFLCKCSQNKRKDQVSNVSAQMLRSEL